MEHNHDHENHSSHDSTKEYNLSTPKVDLKQWIPLAVVFAYIFALTFVFTNYIGWTLHAFMSISMGMFFVVFSMFKMINLKGFAEGYNQYDLVAKKWYTWGYIYPFVELALGLMYLGLVESVWLHSVTIAVSLLVVLSVAIELKKHGKFYCACLGTVLKVPLTKVSLAEYLVMAVMALVMLLGY